MVLFHILSGSRAGAEIVACHFPFRVGRGARADLRLEGGGVWDEHCEVTRDAGRGMLLRSHAAALTLVNGHKIEEVALRNGDLIELGEIRLQFWLAPAVQTRLTLRETSTWIALAALVVGQFSLIYWLTH
jgi:pSer/pThr/pTyr-binding forkhead associated (FHA) protein